MEKMWGVHMRADESYDAVEQGYVAIGWHEVGNILDVEPTREAYKSLVAQTYPDMKIGAIPGSAGNLYRFVHEIEEGDWVILPSKHDRMINIGRFSGPPYRTEGEYPNRRNVTWLNSLPRDEFSQSALYEIGSP